MYTDFAAVYDRLMRTVDYDTWARYYAALLKKAGVADGPVCECACGTGELTLRLARMGYRMTGVDLSQEMLSLAQQKARDQGLTLPFVRQDMCRLALHRRQRAILCTCDGVNYLLTPERARRFFRAAYGQLVPGGALIFDVSTPEKLQNTLGNHTLGCQDEDVSYVWQNAWRPRAHTVEMQLSIFVRQEDGCYERFEERQTQRAYSEEELRAMLEETGFARIRIYGGLTQRAPREGAERWHVSAIRPKEK
ncbi:MAG: methyltransferase domain-containing protein [Clostridia bacterium]|nr:methyltransferase domain-containing protein [Clostridia bacterium]